MEICLRALEPEDLDFLYSLENEPEMWEVGTPGGPYSRYALRSYIASQPQDAFQGGSLRLIACRKADGKAIGTADLLNVSATDRRAEVGLAVLAAERGKGYGGEILSLLERHARDILHLRLLYALVAAEGNAPSRQTFLRCGFRQTATLPQWHFRRNGYEDIAVMTKFL